MSSKLDRIGRTAAVVSSLILFAMLVNLHLMNAAAHETSPELPRWEKTRAIRESEEPDLVSRLAEQLSRPFGNKEAALLEAEGRLYVVDDDGRVLGTADSLRVQDLPVISGKSLHIDENEKRCSDEGLLDALRLLRKLQQYDEIEPLISGMEVSQRNVTAYVNLGRVVPVLFGRGNWEHKVENLVEYYRQLGADELTRRARFLDLRVEDCVIVKKNG